MEPNNGGGNLFELQIDTQSHLHLMQAAKWAKFLSIVGFICCGLLLLWGIFAGTLFSSISNRLSSESGMPINPAANFSGAFILIFTLIGAVLYFFPCLYLYRFSVRMQGALNSNEQSLLTNSFGNLKAFYRFIGILTIIGLALFLLEIIFVLVFAAAASR